MSTKEQELATKPEGDDDDDDDSGVPMTDASGKPLSKAQKKKLKAKMKAEEEKKNATTFEVATGEDDTAAGGKGKKGKKAGPLVGRAALAQAIAEKNRIQKELEDKQKQEEEEALRKEKEEEMRL